MNPILFPAIGMGAQALGTGLKLLGNNMTKRIEGTYSLEDSGNSFTQRGRITGATGDLIKRENQGAYTKQTKLGKILSGIGTGLGIAGGITEGIRFENKTGPPPIPEEPFKRNRTPIPRMPMIPGLINIEANIPMRMDKFSNNPPEELPQKMKSGGMNSGSAEAVEAEGGEVLITYDNDYNVVEAKPIVGPSHSKGGVDTAIGKNQAILNRKQQLMLKQGIHLKDILDILPDVKDIAKANMGGIGDDEIRSVVNPGVKPLQYPKLIRDIFDYMNKDKQMLKERIAKEIQAEHSVNLPNGYSVIGNAITNPVYPLNPVSPTWPGVTLNAQIETPPTNTATVTTTNASSPASSSNNVPEKSESVGEQKPATPSKKSSDYVNSKIVLAPKTISDILVNNPAKERMSRIEKVDNSPFTSKIRFNIGPEEFTLMGDTVRNFMAMTQGDAEQIPINNVRVDNPVYVTPKRTNADPYLESNKEAFNATMAAIMQNGQRFMVPAVFSGQQQGIQKISQEITAKDNESQDRAMALNAEAANRVRLAQNEMNAKTRDLRFQEEEKRSMINAAKKEQRILGAANLLYAKGNYRQTKKDAEYVDKMRELLYRRARSTQ